MNFTAKIIAAANLAKDNNVCLREVKMVKYIQWISLYNLKDLNINNFYF